MKTSKAEMDSLLANRGGSTLTQTSKWSKRSIAFVTCLLILVLLYLIASNVAPLKSRSLITTPEQSTHPIGSDPFTNWQECNASPPPAIIGYHIHFVFDGNDQEAVSNALEQNDQFMAFMNPISPMTACLFGHSYPSKQQQTVCYFPSWWAAEEFPVPTNAIFQASNYGFFVPQTYLQKVLTFWMQNNAINGEYFSYLIHSVSGCQINDHSKWAIKNGNFDGYDLVTDNLVCCHNGPSLCSCNIVQYGLEGNCLGMSWVDGNNKAVFVKTVCEDAERRSVGSWREVFYDESKNWFQIENYGDVIHPMYLCLTVVGDGSVELMDCSFGQDVANDIWISEKSKFYYDVQNDQVKYFGNGENNLCLHVAESGDGDNRLELSVVDCDIATIFAKRYFFP